MTVRILFYIFIGFILFLNPTSVSATSDEDAWGHYSYRDTEFCIEFNWDIDGIKDVTINGVRYKGPLSYTEYGIVGGTARYDIVFNNSVRESRSMQLFILFDDNKLKSVAGLYYEIRKVSAGHFDVALAKAMILKHRAPKMPPGTSP